MKITNHDIIKSGEQELIDAITADLDWGAIEDIFSQAHKLKIEDNVAYKKGDIVVFNGQIAYQLEFDVNVVLSVLLDREGNYLSLTSSGGLDAPQNNSEDDPGKEAQEESGNSLEATLSETDVTDTSENDDELSSGAKAKEPREKISEMASRAGAMVSEIEDQDLVMAENA